ncbi:unnamed protein product [marine sediment metagenome]|uniref:Uncharacterized protein n=1 Tax=marine sediment metagenome TaxID=412755 RepID=X1ATD0_9ZZZZ
MGRGIRIGATAGIVAGIWQTWQGWKRGGVNGIVTELTGWKMSAGEWAPKEAKAAIAMLAGCGLSMAASKIGLNRYTPKGINI